MRVYKLEEEAQRLQIRIDKILNAIQKGLYLDTSHCKNCGGAGWTFTNIYDSETTKCQKCKTNRDEKDN